MLPHNPSVKNQRFSTPPFAQGRLFTIFFPVICRGDAHGLLEDADEVREGIEPGVHGDVQYLPVGEDQHLGGFGDPHVVDVLDGSLEGDLLEQTAEMALAHAAQSCQVVDGDGAAVVVVDVLGHLFDAPEGAASPWLRPQVS